MENSHRRIIAELEEKHRQEIEQLRHEKEQALAEETQATLAGENKRVERKKIWRGHFIDVHFFLRVFKELMCY